MKKLNNAQILAILVKAKEEFIEDKYKGETTTGMCWYLARHIELFFNTRDISYTQLSDLIPEFTYEYLTGNSKPVPIYSYWWDNYLIAPRLNAFDKLISLYIQKIKDENN